MKCPNTKFFLARIFPHSDQRKLLNIFHAVTILYLKCDQASGLCQKLELASELESDPRHTVNWGQELVVDFNIGKIQLASFN